MKTKLLLFSALAFVILCFNGCTPEEVETTQNQFKPLIIRVTLADPITANDEINNLYNNLGLAGSNAQGNLSGSVPNQVGQNVIEVNTTAVSNTQLFYTISYIDLIGLQGVGKAATPVFDCNEVHFELIYDGQTLINDTKVMGSDDGTCPDGQIWGINFTLP
jgi:hypothetical protein